MENSPEDHPMDKFMDKILLDEHQAKREAEARAAAVNPRTQWAHSRQRGWTNTTRFGGGK